MIVHFVDFGRIFIHHSLNFLFRSRVMKFNATFNNVPVILWRSVLLEDETEYLAKTTDLSQVTDKLFHNVLSSTPCNERNLNSQF